MAKRDHLELTKTINERSPCFLIGNGINRYDSSEGESDLSWEGLLLDVYNSLSTDSKDLIPKGIALTEFFDVINLFSDQKTGANLQKELVKMLDWKPQPHHKRIVDRIAERNAPIVTTNFDFTLQKAVMADMYRHRTDDLRLLNDFYPWDSYFSNGSKEDPFNAFSIWHMHGQKNYHRSIKLGLHQYLLMADIAKRFLPHREEASSFRQTWVRLFFEKDLIIFGLGLNEQEIFIRWLLIQRAKYFKNQPKRRRLGFYINHDKPNTSNAGKRFFLESIGFQYVDFIDDYAGFYEDFWERL